MERPPALTGAAVATAVEEPVADWCDGLRWALLLGTRPGDGYFDVPADADRSHSED